MQARTTAPEQARVDIVAHRVDDTTAVGSLMSGHGVAVFQSVIDAHGVGCGWRARAPVESTTVELYQPSRVLISVLFTPAASTRRRTSAGPGCGIGTWRTSIISNPPFPRDRSGHHVAACPEIHSITLAIVSLQDLERVQVGIDQRLRLAG